MLLVSTNSWTDETGMTLAREKFLKKNSCKMRAPICSSVCLKAKQVPWIWISSRRRLCARARVRPLPNGPLTSSDEDRGAATSGVPAGVPNHVARAKTSPTLIVSVIYVAFILFTVFTQQTRRVFDLSARWCVWSGVTDDAFKFILLFISLFDWSLLLFLFYFIYLLTQCK